MVDRVLIGTVLVCGALGVTGLAAQTVRVRPGTPARGQPPAQAKAVFVEACGRCHPIERVTATRRTRAQWEETVNAMVTSRGATLTPEQYDTVLKYLAAEYGPVAGATTGQAPVMSPRASGGAGADDKMVVDADAAMRGRTTYAAGCIQCHGTQARGTDRGANLVRSLVVLHDRYGSELGPFLKKGHPAPGAGQGQGTGSFSSADLTDAQIADLSHFLHEKLNDTLRGAPGFTVQNVLTGNRAAGAAYFDGAGGCRQCHSVTGDLAGIGARYDPPTMQQRFLFPRPPGRGPRAFGGRPGGRAAGAGAAAGAAGAAGGGAPGATGAAGAAGAASATPEPKQVTVSVTTASGETMSGELVHLDDFNVSLRDISGGYRSWKRTPGLTVVKHDPYATHVAMLDTLTDKNIHDIVAYLESLK